MSNLGNRLTLISLAAALCAADPASVGVRPAVVELFTAQGCSSCPPVDAYIGRLAERHDVLPLAFHVDYWDSSGWRDRFELHQSVERQHRYAQVFHESTVYTPQLVLDGHRVAAGSAGILSMNENLDEPREGVPVSISAQPEEDITVQVGAISAHTKADVLLVTYQRHASTAVARGENAGRTLEDFNIVRSIQTLGRWSGAAQNYQFPRSRLPADATDVAVLVQEAGQGSIVGAAARELH
jgi:hypothetical protein